PSSSHNVFINGLEIGDPISSDGPTDLALSGLTIAKAASIGTTVGSFTTTDPTPADTFIYTFASGAGDTHNGQFIINGADLETDRDLSGFAGGTILSVRIRTTDALGAFYEEIFNIEVLNDSDMDDLDDDWELLYFANLGVATGSGNNDGDSLTNAEEQAAGTSPILADTDSDGLDDDDEINTYGTNPLVQDTDADGINDNDEVTGANGFVTDPTKEDSDGDGFNDALEVSEGTDPNNPADFPNTLIPLQLNEILTRNVTDISDGFGNREDWIEIYNPNTTLVNLDGYYLTDNAGIPTKWNFPAVTIPASGYLVVFASGKDVVDPGGAAHTNFNLSSAGEYLAIVRPDGTTVDDAFSPACPEQFTNISYGPPAAGGTPVFFETSTPGAVNNTAQYPGVVKDTNFSIDRGFYTAAFPLTITSATPGATIRYTTDGSKPSTSNGTVYTGPINITTTSTIRAFAYFSDWLPTNVDSHTYIFVDDVLQQPANPPGWPVDWSNSGDPSVIHPADYEMDPRVVNDDLGLAEHTMQEALLDIPTVSITMNPSDFLNSDAEPATGIYSNPRSRWERTCSMEYILPDGTPGFQEDCKIEVHGNASRRPARMHKHSLRLTFSSTVDKPKLEYPLFPQSDVETFNKLVLRACFTDSWALVSWSSSRYRPNDSMYMRDVWMKDSMRAMGNASGNGDFVHLYVNGLYWGLHDLTERYEDDWYADHIGGKTEDWEVNADILTPGPLWNSMLNTLNGNIVDNAVYEQAKNVIDIDNYIDYTFLHFYADAEDWPTKNGYAAVNVISGDGRWRFQVWDQEISLDKFSWNRYGSNSGSMQPFQRLRLNEEFRMRFADRVAKHVYNGGALTEQSSGQRFLGICAEMDKAIMAESARWGDVQANTPYGSTASSSTDPFSDHYPPLINNPIYFTREQHWLVERDNVVNNHMPVILDESDSRGIIPELRGQNLYPSIDAPVFAQHGGVVANGYELTITATTGSIYYTLDGSDPREVGGGINPGAGMLTGGNTVTLTQTGTLKSRVLNGGEWSALTEADFIVGTPASAGNLVVSEIYYNPPGADESTEWIELMNISGGTIDLTDVSMTGITYTFPSGWLLPAGGRIVVVKDLTAFSAAYNTAGITIAPGVFSSSLSNGGEELAIIDASGSVDIQRFTYLDVPPWPTGPDGGGYSLVLVAPDTLPDHGVASNWRSSVAIGGSPGTSDTVEFSGNPNDDLDGDGIPALLEHAFGSINGDAGASPESQVVLGTGLFEGGTVENLTMIYRRNMAADDVIIEAEISGDLVIWDPLGVEYVSSIPNGDGTETVTFRSKTTYASIN
ncbi:lamin tail domain-containing protein, partial [Akkermansiaceae bacterium]|nr:lamin tail domain-containing protein [Akkermansiaceae bacterium]